MPQRIVDLTLSDNMPAHKLFQRPIVTPHLTHQKTQSFGLVVPEDKMTFATTFIATIDHIATHVDAFYHTNPDGLPVDESLLDDPGDRKSVV